VTRNRKCRNVSNGQFCKNIECEGENKQSEIKLPENKCCNWEEWSLWSTASNTCTESTITRQRTCSGMSNCSDEDCEGGGEAKEETKTIEALGKCCEWAIWSVWSTMPDKCQTSEVSRTRECVSTIDSSSQCLVDDCEGALSASTETKTAPAENCCAWTDWTESSCSVTCGAGKIKRTRDCQNSERSSNYSCQAATDCEGEDGEEIDCETAHCPSPGSAVVQPDGNPNGGAWSDRKEHIWRKR